MSKYHPRRPNRLDRQTQIPFRIELHFTERALACHAWALFDFLFVCFRYFEVRERKRVSDADDACGARIGNRQRGQGKIDRLTVSFKVDGDLGALRGQRGESVDVSRTQVHGAHET